MVMAWLIEKSLKCPDCGTYYEEFDEAKGGHRHAYFPKARFCLGCKAKEDSYAAIKENHKNNPSATNGLQMDLERNPSAPGIRSPLSNKPIQQHIK